MLPAVPHRQWVITFPHETRYLLAWNAEVGQAMLDNFMAAVRRHVRTQAARAGFAKPQTGAISVLQRFDSALDRNLHWHVLFADGVWQADDRQPQFVPAPPLRELDLAKVQQDALDRMLRWLGKRGWTKRNDDPHAKQEPALSAIPHAAMARRPFADQPVQRDRPVQRTQTLAAFATPAGRHCVRYRGFSLHANTCIVAMDRKGLEELVTYVLRPAVAADRLEVVDEHRIRLRRETPWKDGTTAVVYHAFEFI